MLTQASQETHAGVHALSPAEVREFLLQSYAGVQEERARILFRETRKPSRSIAIPRWPADLRRYWIVSRPAPLLKLNALT